MNKKIISILAASLVSASTMISSTVYAESPEYYFQNENEFAEFFLKHVEDTMAQIDYEKSTDGVFDIRILKDSSCDPNDVPYYQIYCSGYDESPNSPEVYLIYNNPFNISINLNINHNSDDSNLYYSRREALTNYLEENYPTYSRDGNNTIKLKSKPGEQIPALNYKELVKDLVENKLIDSADLEFGSATSNSHYPDEFLEPISCFQSTYERAKDKETASKNQDIIDFYAKGKLDCEFGIFMSKDDVPDGMDYTIYSEIDSTSYIGFYNGLAYIPITPEEATKLDAETIDNIQYFRAVPKENTLINQTELLVEINRNVRISGMSIGGKDYAGPGPDIEDISFDITNAVNGDANCDEKFSIADATAILQHLGNPDEYGLSLKGMYNADCGGVMDGVTAADAMFIQSKLAKG